MLYQKTILLRTMTPEELLSAVELAANESPVIRALAEALSESLDKYERFPVTCPCCLAELTEGKR